jgi:hypothetical protein
MEPKQQMHAQHLGQHLAVAIAFSLLLLIVGIIGLGVAVPLSGVDPHDLDVSLSGFRIIAYTTDPSECQPNFLCPRSTREYQVIWVVRESAPEYVHETWHRILNVPLRHSVFAR